MLFQTMSAMDILWYYDAVVYVFIMMMLASLARILWISFDIPSIRRREIKRIITSLKYQLPSCRFEQLADGSYNIYDGCGH